MVEYSRESLFKSIASACTTDLGGDFLLSSITSTWLDTICTFDETGFGVLLTFEATELADTTRTTLDNCFVDLATGFEGLISVFDVTSVTGFVSITGGCVGVGVSTLGTAFGSSIWIKNWCSLLANWLIYSAQKKLFWSVDLSKKINYLKVSKQFDFRFHHQKWRI